MTNTQVSTARKFAVAAFSGVVALSLMLPTQLAFADYNVGDQTYSGTEDNSGEGSEGGTWSYTAEGQEMTLVDYVGAAITATEQDLNIQLEGDNKVEERVSVSDGNLTITGDDSVYGDDKPSLTIVASDEQKASNSKLGTGGSISANAGTVYDSETGALLQQKDNGSLTIKDVNVKFDTTTGGISANGGDLTIQDSKVERGSGNESLSISERGQYDQEAGEYKDSSMLLKGSVIDATRVSTEGTLTIDNTDLTVTPDKTAQEQIDKGYYDKEGAVPWIARAVRAAKGITLKGEENGEVVKYEKDGKTWYYLTTGDDYKVELKASSTPAYWGGTKGMPATGDATMPLAVGLSITAMAAAGFVLYSRKSAYAGKHVK